VRADLERVQLRNADDLLLHRVGGRAALRPYFAAFGVPANSDFYPVLDTNAAKARYLYRPSDDLQRLLESGIPLLELFEGARVPDPARLSPGSRSWLPRSAYALQARAAAAYLRSGRTADLQTLLPAAAADLVLLRGALVDCSVALTGPMLRRVSTQVAWFVNQHLATAERSAIWSALEGSRCAARLTEMERHWLRLHAAVARGDAARMVQASERILEGDTEVTQDLLAYALAAHMTGRLLGGQAKEAMAAIARHGPRVGNAPSWQPAFRFLVAQARR
jgi:spermidine synthase